MGEPWSKKTKKEESVLARTYIPLQNDDENWWQLPNLNRLLHFPQSIALGTLPLVVTRHALPLSEEADAVLWICVHPCVRETEIC